MAEEIKEKIYQFLKEHRNEEFSISKLRENLGHAYPSILKWVMVLAAESDMGVKIKDFGNIKLVSYVGECKQE